jgi:hypothetical protein
MSKQTPISCPSCKGALFVSEFKCPDCNTVVKGKFNTPLFGDLNEEQLAFIKIFILSRGNIKEVENRMGISYPTVRNKLDDVIATLSDAPIVKMTSSEILDALESGKISAAQATDLLAENK